MIKALKLKSFAVRWREPKALSGISWWNEDHLVRFTAGDYINITAGNRPVRFLLVSGKQIKEPVAWYGPIVMNTQEELQIAFEEYQNGTFIKDS